MFRLVALRPVAPNVIRSVDVARSQVAHFGRPAAGQVLNANHVGDDRWQMGQRGVDHRFLDRKHGRGLTSLCASLLEPSNSL